MIRPGVSLLVGRVMHQRLWPWSHRFVYPVFYVRLALSALPNMDGIWFGVDCARPLSLRTRDYGPRDGGDLLPWIRGLLGAAGLDASGEVYLQTMPRIFGYAFNPISCWYCHDASGQLRAILADVNNTFGEHHRYLLGVADGGVIGPRTALHCRKQMHVSPFCEVKGSYHFRILERPDHGVLSIDYHDGERLVLRTAVSGRLAPATDGTLRRALWRQPLLTFGVTARILWQALRLWLRRLPIHSKPPYSI